MTLCESADRQKVVADDMYRKCLFCEHMNMQVKK